jgi:hypothetical protein
VTDRTHFQSSTNTSSSAAATSQRVFYADGGEEKHCSHCFAESGRKLPHASVDCRNNKRRQNQETGCNNRSAPDSDDKEVTCYRCNERGYYSSNCTNPPAAGGRGGRNQRGRGRDRGGRGGAYYLWVPDEGESGNSQYTNTAAAPHFSGVLQGHLNWLCHRRPNRPNRWIYDTGCTAHSAISAKIFTLWLLTTNPCTRRTELA